MVYRVYVEKKENFAVESAALQAEFIQTLNIKGLCKTRIAQRYDIEGIDAGLFAYSVSTVLSEPPLDKVYYQLPTADYICAVEYLPGQFDQRADSAAECIQLISHDERPSVEGAKLYMFDGKISAEDKCKIEKYLINPVDSRRADLSEKKTLQACYTEPEDIKSIEGFIDADKNSLIKISKIYSLAMDSNDLAFCVNYFKKENRDPTVTELLLIDAYWSDHCRHTTFNTILDKIEIEYDSAGGQDGLAPDDLYESYQRYLEVRKIVHGEKDVPVTLMDIATIAAKYLSKEGKLKNWDINPENNACSIEIKVDNDERDERWLLMFKNETHNHPTEIEPFGGAATCIGGAIRDPLSGRAYVYQAMRVTGAGDPLLPIEDTLPGKLPQRKLVIGAAQGYSSYGNQVGLATGIVKEFYHEGYTAKRMEIGAVLGAVPAANVRREEPAAGDVVILVGGRTGRDGCGGATGSSKAHTSSSIEKCGAEVQKGNAPIERQLQRLFRNPDAALMIKRCNDFGAGGAAVAIGELADGLIIDLDAIPKKYEGLDGTELTISESQERMAVLVDARDAEAFAALAFDENLEAAVAARVTDEKRLVIRRHGKNIVNIARDFLNSSGAERHASVCIKLKESVSIKPPPEIYASFTDRLAALLRDLNVSGAKGLFERFDSTIGAGTVLMPAGGIYQLTQAQCMAAKIPVEGETKTCSGMSFGFDPYVSEASPYEGAYTAVLESIAKLAASGFPVNGAYLSLQEYFPSLRDDPHRWGRPFAALLGAFQAQLDLGAAAIGGKDSMSGSFENLDVPPSLVSFAVAAGNVENIISGEFKKSGHEILWVRPLYRSVFRPDAESFKAALNLIEKLIFGKKAVSVYAASRFGIIEALFKMCCGNRIGIQFEDIGAERLFEYSALSFAVELNDGISVEDIKGESKNIFVETIGRTISVYKFIINGQSIDLMPMQEIWEEKFESIFPYRGVGNRGTVTAFSWEQRHEKTKSIRQEVKGRPRALIPVFPGTNCEYDTARALRMAGAEPEIFVIQNLRPESVEESADTLVRKIRAANMLVIPGGFSGGDEPDGSAKLIAAFFRGSAVADAVMDLVEMRDGLILGICNGFQALIKLGLVPFGKITGRKEDDPTLTFNTLGRHQSLLVRTKICSGLSPWFLCEKPGAIHTIPVSHGEGRFVGDEGFIAGLGDSGQIAAQYVDLDGKPTMDLRYNPAGSMMAVEALTDPSGRILGKMAHSERRGEYLYKNVPGNKTQKLFEGGVKYFCG
jgi:phosphoribosylformylglycinamidine synthase